MHHIDLLSLVSLCVSNKYIHDQVNYIVTLSLYEYTLWCRKSCKPIEWSCGAAHTSQKTIMRPVSSRNKGSTLQGCILGGLLSAEGLHTEQGLACTLHFRLCVLAAGTYVVVNAGKHCLRRLLHNRHSVVADTSYCCCCAIRVQCCSGTFCKFLSPTSYCSLTPCLSSADKKCTTASCAGVYVELHTESNLHQVATRAWTLVIGTTQKSLQELFHVVGVTQCQDNSPQAPLYRYCTSTKCSYVDHPAGRHT